MTRRRLVVWLAAALMVVTVFFASEFVVAAIARWLELPHGPTTGVPQVNQYGSYAADITLPSGELTHLIIDRDGNACSVVEASRNAYRTCLLTTNLTPSLIGGEAYGELNTSHTPALDALIWRARASADTSVCPRGGLEGTFLSLCETAASDESYVYRADGFTIRIPIGGAVETGPP